MARTKERPPNRQFVSIHKHIGGSRIYVHRGTGQFGMYAPGLRKVRANWHEEDQLTSLEAWGSYSVNLGNEEKAVVVNPDTKYAMAVNVVWDSNDRAWKDATTGIAYAAKNIYPNTPEVWESLRLLKLRQAEIHDAQRSLDASWDLVFEGQETLSPTD